MDLEKQKLRIYNLIADGKRALIDNDYDNAISWLRFAEDRISALKKQGRVCMQNNRPLIISSAAASNGRSKTPEPMQKTLTESYTRMMRQWNSKTIHEDCRLIMNGNDSGNVPTMASTRD